MTSVLTDEKIPNNVNLVERQAPAARARGVAARVHRLVEADGPDRLAGARHLPAHRGLRRDRRLGALRLREDARLPLGHLPRAEDRKAARTASATSTASRCGTRSRASSATCCAGSIVTQGDTEPASVEQQRDLGATAPSLYDLRNLFQVNVEEGRHLWAMVYLLHTYFGRDGREEAEELLAAPLGRLPTSRASSARSTSRPPHWLSFFMFTMFTDRDGKYQLSALAESGFDPLARTCRFMLTEEAHHMFVGETGVQRVVKRACELMKQTRRRRRARRAASICRRSRST